jgi:hypothetical protein
MYGPDGLYNTTVQHKNVCKSSYTPDDGPVWPNLVMNLHDGTEHVLSQPIICEAAFKTVLHTLIKQWLKYFLQPK